MTRKVTIYCAVVLLLLCQVGAKPMSSLQTLMHLLEEENINNNLYVGSDETLLRELDETTAESESFNTGSELPWGRISRGLDSQSSKEIKMTRLLNDILTSSKRSTGRLKKKGSRSCFGVRLNLIGSMNGLGC
ncbi:ANFC protein, partial [Polyodon spathula]|nr:C-type natriuretic peptide 3-like [Polyodon spathula]MBN3272346.1 ANFC protein [Polyodon spathula]